MVSNVCRHHVQSLSIWYCVFFLFPCLPRSFSLSPPFSLSLTLSPVLLSAPHCVMARTQFEDNVEWNDTELTSMALEIMGDLQEASIKCNVDPADSFLYHLDIQNEPTNTSFPLSDLDAYAPSLAIRKHSSITAFHPDPDPDSDPDRSANASMNPITSLPPMHRFNGGLSTLSHSDRSHQSALPPLPDSTAPSHRFSLPPIRSPDCSHNPFAMQYAIEPNHALNLSRHIAPSPRRRKPSPRRHAKVSPLRYADRRKLNSPASICTPPTSEIHPDSETLLSSISTLKSLEIGSIPLTHSADRGPDALRIFPSYSGHDIDPVPSHSLPSGTRTGSMLSRPSDVDIFECISPVQRCTKMAVSSTIPDFSTFVAATRSDRKSKRARNGMNGGNGSKRIPRPPSPLPFDAVHSKDFGDFNVDRPKQRISVPVGLPMTRRIAIDRGEREKEPLSRDTTASPGPLPYFVKRDRNPFTSKSPKKMAVVPDGIAAEGTGFRLDDDWRTLSIHCDVPRRRQTLKTKKTSPRSGRRERSRTPQPKRKRKGNAAIIPRSKNRGVIQRPITPMAFQDLKRRRAGGGTLEHTLSSPVIGKRKQRRSARKEKGKMAQSARFLGVNVHDEYAVSSDEGDCIYYLQPLADPAQY